MKTGCNPAHGARESISFQSSCKATHVGDVWILMHKASNLLDSQLNDGALWSFVTV